VSSSSINKPARVYCQGQEPGQLRALLNHPVNAFQQIHLHPIATTGTIPRITPVRGRFSGFSVPILKMRQVLATVRPLALPGEVEVLAQFRLNWLPAHGESLPSAALSAV
jgi:hypothetical protein